MMPVQYPADRQMRANAITDKECYGQKGPSLRGPSDSYSTCAHHAPFRSPRYRAEAKAIAPATRTAALARKSAIPADGQMFQWLRGRLKFHPHGQLFRTEREHLGVGPPVRTVDCPSRIGQARTDDPSFLRSPGSVPAPAGGEGRRHLAPEVLAFRNVVLDEDGGGLIRTDIGLRAGPALQSGCPGPETARAARTDRPNSGPGSRTECAHGPAR